MRKFIEYFTQLMDDNHINIDDVAIDMDDFIELKKKNGPSKFSVLVNTDETGWSIENECYLKYAFSDFCNSYITKTDLAFDRKIVFILDEVNRYSYYQRSISNSKYRVHNVDRRIVIYNTIYDEIHYLISSSYKPDKGDSLYENDEYTICITNKYIFVIRSTPDTSKVYTYTYYKRLLRSKIAKLVYDKAVDVEHFTSDKFKYEDMFAFQPIYTITEQIVTKCSVLCNATAFYSYLESQYDKLTDKGYKLKRLAVEQRMLQMMDDWIATNENNIYSRYISTFVTMDLINHIAINRAYYPNSKKLKSLSVTLTLNKKCGSERDVIITCKQNINAIHNMIDDHMWLDNSIMYRWKDLFLCNIVVNSDFTVQFRYGLKDKYNDYTLDPEDAFNMKGLPTL